MSAEKSAILNLFAKYAGRGRDYGKVAGLLEKLGTVKVDCDACDTRKSDVKKAYDDGFTDGVSSVKVGDPEARLLAAEAKPAPKARSTRKVKPKPTRKSTTGSNSKDTSED